MPDAYARSIADALHVVDAEENRREQNRALTKILLLTFREILT